jgi:hypothetical protein
MFVDIVDSSIYSSILGTVKFAQKVLQFQELFLELGNRYFKNNPHFESRVDSFCQIESRGDEGQVFIVDPREKGEDLVYRAVKFAFELKAKLKLLTSQDADPAPREMSIAVGIHYGEVAVITTSQLQDEIYRTLIERITGYSINYAKRVESSSRIGRFSHVFLSKEAADLLSYTPIVLCKHHASLKGIQANEELYEVRSAFLSEIPLPSPDINARNQNEQLVTYYTTKCSKNEFLREPWLKSFVLSVLHTKLDETNGTTLMNERFERISHMVWNKPTEDDPILLYWRARECESQDKFSRSVNYLKDIISTYPAFLHARIKIIDMCYQMTLTRKSIAKEMLFVRDTAEELLEKYDNLLLDKERDKLKSILIEINSN